MRERATGSSTYRSEFYNWKTFFANSDSEKLPGIHSCFMIKIQNHFDEKQRGIYTKSSSDETAFSQWRASSVDEPLRLLRLHPPHALCPSKLPRVACARDKIAALCTGYFSRYDIENDYTHFIPRLIAGDAIQDIHPGVPLRLEHKIASILYPSYQSPPLPPTPPSLITQPSSSIAASTTATPAPIPIFLIRSNKWEFNFVTGECECVFEVQFDQDKAHSGHYSWSRLIANRGDELPPPLLKYLNEHYHDAYSVATGPFKPPRIKADEAELKRRLRGRQ